MALFTSPSGLSPWRVAWLSIGFAFCAATALLAQPETNSSVPGPGEITAASSAAATNTPPATVAAPATTDAQINALAGSVSGTVPKNEDAAHFQADWTEVALPMGSGPLLAFASLAGFLLYQCGLTRAKNSGHTSTLLLVGVLFAITGYWIGGFAVQTGGIGDAHAALAQPIAAAEKSSLDHELGAVVAGHHWGFMGSAGFFLDTDSAATSSIAAIFLMQAALLAIAVGATLGAALERGQLRAMAICAFLIGVLIYPFFANWVWGGGWLAELGREFGLGHGFVDLGGAAVVHETAGTLALVLAIVLGPRHGRFGRDKSARSIPGHHVPFIVLGSVVLLLSWMATNSFTSECLTSAVPSGTGTVPTTATGLAAINTLLAAIGGLIFSFLQASSQKRRPEPARLCRGLLGGAVASCGGAALVDPWAAFLIGGVAGFLVQGAMVFLERKRIDDPIGASAVHGVSGAWGVIAVGLFANGSAGAGFNGVTTDGGIRGLFFGGAWHQLAAQVLGCVTCFVAVYVLAWASVSLVQRIVGLRVPLAAEVDGLDLTEVGALGYQGDVEPED